MFLRGFTCFLFIDVDDCQYICNIHLVTKLILNLIEFSITLVGDMGDPESVVSLAEKYLASIPPSTEPDLNRKQTIDQIVLKLSSTLRFPDGITKVRYMFIWYELWSWLFD